MQLIAALLNVITIGGLIIWVEGTAMKGSTKQIIGVVLIIIGLIVGFLTTGSLVIR